MRWSGNNYKSSKIVTKNIIWLLVRMRSPFPSLKDMETKTAPARHFLTPGRVTQPRRKKQEAGTRPPVFSCSPAGPPRPQPSKPHAPQGIRATQSPRGQRPGLASPSVGDCMERNQPLAPPYARGAATAQAPPVAGRPVPASATPLYCKNTLRLTLKWCRIVAPRQIKGRAQGVTSTPRPYAGECRLPHNSV